MDNYPICNLCGAGMTEYDGCSWYTCPECGQAKRDNGDGSWSWKDELFKQGTKEHKLDFGFADFSRGGDLTEG